MAVKRVTNGANLRFSTTLSAFVFTEAAFSETMVAVYVRRAGGIRLMTRVRSRA